MVNAEKSTVNGRDWIKVSFPHIPAMMESMKRVNGALHNPSTDLWAVPFENKQDFENKMGDYLIIWKGEEDTLSAGGISEASIPREPVVPSYSVTYNEFGDIVDSTGFKTRPWGEFQVKGFNTLVTRDFLILADDAGLGKTWQVATAMEARKKLGHLKRGVIVCKASLLFNWRDEIMKHTYEKPVVVAGSVKKRSKLYSNLTYDDSWTFLIVSYETFRMDIANIQLLDSLKGLDFIVLDEAHKIKNPQSRIGSLVHYVPFKYKYVLTATPLPNSPLESYNYLHLGGKVNENWFAFENRYAIKGGFNGKEVIGYQNIRELRNIIQLNMLRRLKKDKLKELPEVAFKTIPIEMSAAQWKLYNAVKKEILEDLADTSLTKIPSALTKLLRLQQVTDSPSIIESTVKSSKLDTLDDTIEELVKDGGQKVIIFSRFRSMVELLEEKYKMFNPAIIHGDIDANGKSERAATLALKRKMGANKWETLSASERDSLLTEAMTSERQKQVYKFQSDDSCRIFIGCTPACREGLTLTAATHVIFLDCEWSPAYVEQAFSRAHRIGQKNAVTVHYLVCADTIDEYVQKVLARKDSMAQAMLDNGVKAVGQQRARDMIAELIGATLRGIPERNIKDEELAV